MRLLLDSDVHLDSLLALHYLLQLQQNEGVVELELLTLTHGRTSLNEGALQLMQAMQRYQTEVLQQQKQPQKPFQVAMGAMQPLFVENAYVAARPPPVFAQTPVPLYQISRSDAVECLREHLDRSPPQSLVILSLGPLSNLASLFKNHPQSLQRVKRIFVAGGCVHSPAPGGNHSPVAEFNFYSDPHAASVLLNSGLPITLLPLDATEFARLRYGVSRDTFVMMAKKHPLPEAVSDYLERTFSWLSDMEEDMDAVLHSMHDLSAHSGRSSRQNLNELSKSPSKSMAASRDGLRTRDSSPIPASVSQTLGVPATSQGNRPRPGTPALHDLQYSSLLGLGNMLRVADPSGPSEYFHVKSPQHGAISIDDVIESEQRQQIRMTQSSSLSICACVAVFAALNTEAAAKKTFTGPMQIETCLQAMTRGMLIVDGRVWRIRQNLDEERRNFTKQLEGNKTLKKSVDVLMQVDQSAFWDHFLAAVFRVKWNAEKHSWQRMAER